MRGPGPRQSCQLCGREKGEQSETARGLGAKTEKRATPGRLCTERSAIQKPQGPARVGRSVRMSEKAAVWRGRAQETVDELGIQAGVSSLVAVAVEDTGNRARPAREKLAAVEDGRTGSAGRPASVLHDDACRAAFWAGTPPHPSPLSRGSARVHVKAAWLREPCPFPHHIGFVGVILALARGVRTHRLSEHCLMISSFCVPHACWTFFVFPFHFVAPPALVCRAFAGAPRATVQS